MASEVDRYNVALHIGGILVVRSWDVMALTLEGHPIIV